jgi:uroporphyrinogen-III synthase
VILYLGLDPTRFVADKPIFHYPVIKIKRLLVAKPLDWPEVTHLLFTSRSSVFHWDFFEGKQILAIGEATAELLRLRGENPLVASEATQEGMVALLRTLDLQGAYLLWPRSTKARNVLANYLESLGSSVRFSPIDLYETHYQKLEPVPSLDEVEEIVFTSPSTVEGFLRIYGSLPKNKQLTAIGPITERALIEASNLLPHLYVL